MRNHKLLTQLQGELEHAVKCRCNQNFTLDVIANTLQDIRKIPNTGKFTPNKSSGFKEKQPFRVEFKGKTKGRVAEMAKKKNSCHNFGSTDHYSNNCPKEKKEVYAIKKVPEEESPIEDSESESMGDAIREPSDDNQDQRKELLVEYQEETPLEIQDIQLVAKMPQDTANKSLCKHTQDAQTFLVTPTRGIKFIHGTATKITFSTTLTSKQKLSLLKILRKNRPAFTIGEEPLGKIKGHDIELYLDVERPYPPILRRPPYPESPETRKEIEKHSNELLDMDVIRKIGHNEIVEITNPVLITWHDGKYRLCREFKALNN
ncbi:hypothetical protein O181_063963 [Austropuccinia psidii MF-1]|uniref:Uncharacterized protein n=1 Tax=Austropuccinia psidii MF-1 TaxID=1389203 RepID=A0A9Q3ESM4_9BASI|nr:hypothetical protein [Austropuccinia psidii MF-1]